MSDYLQAFEEKYEKVVKDFKNEIASVQTGRANPAMIEEVTVEAYGTRTPLKQLATITVPEARTISVQPWDKNILKDIEKAFSVSDMGFSVNNDGSIVRLTVPTMTEETRLKLIKLVNGKLEESKIQLRQIRDSIREEIVKDEKNGHLTEDDKYQYFKELDEYTRKYQTKLEEYNSKKENEIAAI